MAAAIAPMRGILPSLSTFSMQVRSIPTFIRFAPALLAPLALPSLRSLLDLFPPFLLAVPKKKVSHSRKAMRSSGKGLKDKTNIVNCPACGSAKLAHHICANCYSQISRGYKREARERLSARDVDS